MTRFLKCVIILKNAMSAMETILSVISRETGGKSFKTRKKFYDSGDPHSVDYDDSIRVDLKLYAEKTKHKQSIDLKNLSQSIKKPLFNFFLDGSRRIFKVDDIAYDRKVFPILAGQIGVACCRRFDGYLKKHLFARMNVLGLPEYAAQNDNIKEEFNNLLNKINETHYLKKKNFNLQKILPYSSNKLEEGESYEKKATASIQDEMIRNEKELVGSLASKNDLNQNSFLLKDGSLEYKSIGKSRLTKDNYRYVVGASKAFNPELFKSDDAKSNATVLAQLPLYHRTPAYKYTSTWSKSKEGPVTYAIWYVRIRSAERTDSPFEGILKLEKILLTHDEEDYGIESDLIDEITANVINERNPVCYGEDNRWANHLYPIYITEKFIKSNYLSNEYFMNIFK